MIALPPVGNGDATKPETRPEQARDAVLDGLAASTQFLVLPFPVALSGRWRKAGMVGSRPASARPPRDLRNTLPFLPRL